MGPGVRGRRVRGGTRGLSDGIGRDARDVGVGQWFGLGDGGGDGAGNKEWGKMKWMKWRRSGYGFWRL